MTDLSPESRALLKGARDDFEPDDEQRSRVGRALGARLGIAGGSIATTTASASAGAAGAAKAGAGLATSTLLTASKWVGAVVLLAGSAGAVGVARHREGHAPSQPAPTASVAVARQATVPDAARAEASPAGSVAPRQAAPAALAPTPGPARRSAPASRESPPTAAVAEEARLVRQARDSLRSGDAAAALRLLDEHARRFPDGVLAEERSAERISALCKLGREDEAREEVARLLRASPGSTLASGLCGW